MYIRQLLAQRHLHPQITFASPLSPPPPFPDCFCNFPFQQYPHHCDGRQRSAAGAGFPLINAVADMFKGHINTGLAPGRSPVC